MIAHQLHKFCPHSRERDYTNMWVIKGHPRMLPTMVFHPTQSIWILMDDNNLHYWFSTVYKITKWVKRQTLNGWTKALILFFLFENFCYYFWHVLQQLWNAIKMTRLTSDQSLGNHWIFMKPFVLSLWKMMRRDRYDTCNRIRIGESQIPFHSNTSTSNA